MISEYSILIQTQTDYNPHLMKRYVILMCGWNVISSRLILKKKTITFSLNLDRRNNYHFTLLFGNQSLVQVIMTKFLGVYVDDYLTWKNHISFFPINKSQSVGIISRSWFYLSSKTKLTLYYALIYPYITYCNSTWSFTYVSNLNRIFCLKKRVVRVITNSDYRAHSAPLFAKLGI